MYELTSEIIVFPLFFHHPIVLLTSVLNSTIAILFIKYIKPMLIFSVKKGEKSNLDDYMILNVYCCLIIKNFSIFVKIFHYI